MSGRNNKTQAVARSQTRHPQKKGERDQADIFEERLRQAFELNPQIPWTATPAGAIEEFSQRWLTLTGLSWEEALNGGWRKVSHPEDLPRLLATTASAIRTGEPYDLEHRIRAVDGTWRWMHTRAFPHRAEDGQILRWFGFTEDIHKRVEAERICRASEERLRLATDAARMFSWECDLRHGTIQWSENASQLIGCSRDELPTRLEEGCFFLDPAEVDRVLRELDAVIQGRKTDYRIEFRDRRSPPQTGFWEARGRVIYEDSGEALRIVGVTQDVTVRKQAEQEIARQRAELALKNSQLTAIFEHSNVGLVLFEPTEPYRVMAVNRFYQQLLPEPHRSRGLTGLALTDFAPGVNELGILEIFRQVVQSRKGRFVSQTPFDHMVGGRRWWNWTLEPVIQDEKVVALAHLVVEVTAEVRSRELLQNIFDHIPVLLCVWTPDLKQFQFNKHLREVLGWTEADAQDGGFLEKVYPEVECRSKVSEFMVSMERGWRDFKSTARDGRQVDISWANIRLSDGSSIGIGIDVTERRRAEHALHDKTQQLQALLTSAPLGLTFFDRQHRYLQINEVLAEINGLSVKDHIGRTLEELLPVNARAVTPILDRIFETGEAIGGIEIEGETPREPGVRRHWLTGFYPVRGTRGQVEMVGVWVTEITERKRAEEKLQAAHDTFQHLVQNSPFGVYVVDADFRLVHVSAGAQKIFVHVHPLLGRDFAEVLRAVWPEPFASEAIFRFRHTLETGQPYHSLRTIEQRRDIPEVESYDWKTERIVLPDGRLGVVCHFYDLSERQRFEAALGESEERLRLAKTTGQIGIYDYHFAEGEFVVDERVRELWKMESTTRASYGSFLTGIHPEDRTKLDETIHRIIQPGSAGSYCLEIRLSGPPPTRWVVVTGQAIFEQEKPVRLIGTVQDITQQKDFQAELERLVAERTAKLHEVIGELEHFSYSITHDMRAPLRAMRGFAEIVTESLAASPDPNIEFFLKQISTSAERMDLLITDALNYSRTVREDLKLGMVNLDLLLRGMLETYPQFLANRKHIQIEPSLPAVLGNEAALTQCFSNLLGNALKFVHRGKAPDVRIWAENLPGDWCRIWVEDQGIGIANTMIPRVFNMFSRGSGDYEGTGIGLALVRKVVQRMGGRVGVHSELDKGSRFWVELRTSEQAPGSPL